MSRDLMSEEASPIRVVVADDQALFVSGMRMIVESDPGLAFAGSASTGREALAVVEDVRPDVVLMDVRMPGMDGIEATQRITARAENRTRVIILTTFYGSEAVFQAIRGGASGFLVKDSRPEFVLDAIRAVHAGQEVIAPREVLAQREVPAHGGMLAAATTSEIVDDPGDRTRNLERRVSRHLGALTPRERETFLLVARGLSNAEAARASFVSETTVKSHVRSVLGKLKLRSRVQLTIFAYEHGLLE